MTNLPEPARDATIASLTPILDHMRDSGRTCGLSVETVNQIAGAWRRVHTVVPIPIATLVADLDVDALIASFTAAVRGQGKTFRSGSTYATRIRLAMRAHGAWMSGDPHWYLLSIGGRTAAVRRPLAMPDDRIRTVVTPLRRGLDIRMDLPWDLTTAEADLLGALIRNHVDPATGPNDVGPPTT
ncbi:hypothetical protein AB0M43_14620 [Longispora sp. NPDC051575]|uniref:hypothetical protein n=1 Tax=Longispora sp. NPDC051575 TaxID=3154943 RepID=UPI00343E7C22